VPGSGAKDDRGTDQIITAHHAERERVPPHRSMMAMPLADRSISFAER
jgi:hypothetical protein